MKKVLVLLLFILLSSFICFSQEGSDGCKPPSSTPGKDNPDENFAVGNSLAGTVPSYFDAFPFIGIFFNGYHGSTDALLTVLKRGCFYVKEEFDSTAVLDRVKVLVIPTGGLYGMENSEMFKAVLGEYVKNGGTLIVFAQQHGRDFSALPSPDERPLECYGWREDQSCQSNSMYVDTWHPALSSTTKSLISSPIDGYFADYPSNSSVLLRRRVNGMPAMLTYPYGDGRVVVTSMYEDWGNSHGQSTARGRAIVRDLITWAKNPDLEIAEYNLRDNPDPEVNLNLELKNISDKTASNAKILWLDPDRNLYFEEERLVSIPPGENITIPVSQAFSGIPDNKLGIWHIDYILYNYEGDEIQPSTEIDSGRFSLSRPPIELFKVSDLTMNITTLNEQILRGSQVRFEAHFTNRSQQNKSLRLWQDLTRREAEYWGEVVIPAEGSSTVEIIVESSQESYAREFFWLHIFEEDGEGIYGSLRDTFYKLPHEETWTYVGSATRLFRVINPSVEIKAQSDKKVYGRGETVNTALTIENLTGLPLDSTINLRVINSLDEVLYEDSFIRHFEANETVIENENFSLPSDIKWEKYFINVEALNPFQKKLDQDHTYFNVVAPQLKSEATLPSSYQPNSINTVSFVLTNVGLLEVSDGYVELQLSDPEGQLVFREQQNFSLPLAQSTTLNFNIPLTDIKFGYYELTYTVFDGENISRLFKRRIFSWINLSAAFDKNSYRMRDDMNIDLSTINWGKFVSNLTLNLKIPSFEYEGTRNITLNPLQEQDFSFTTQVPTNIGSGLHLAEVTLALPSGSQIKKTYSFAVPESSLLITASDKTEYIAGEALTFQISNSGGVDTSFDYFVSMGDYKKKMFDTSGNGLVHAGGTIEPSFTIPDQASDGEYLLEIEVINNMSLIESHLKKKIQISGIKANLELETDKDIYLPADDISASSKVINLDGEIREGNLHLQVMSREFQGVEKWELYRNPFIHSVRDVIEDIESNMWIGTMGGGVVRYDGESWKVYGTSSGAFDYIESMGKDSAGNIWISSEHGVAKSDGDIWTRYWLPSGEVIVDELRVNSIIPGRDRSVWFATDGQGAYKFDGANWTNYNTVNSDLSDDDVYSVGIDKDNNLWFGTYAGLSKFDGTNWTTYTNSNTDGGLASDRVRAIAMDKDDNLWFGTNAGLSKYDGTNWTIFNTLNSGLAGDTIYIIAEDQNGNLWFGTNGGASKYDGTYWTTYNTSNSGLKSNYVVSFVAAEGGDLWFAAGGLCRFDGTNWTTYEATDVKLEDNDIRKIFVDDQNVKWLGTFKGGVCKLDGSEGASYSTSNSGLVDDWAISIAKDKEGNLWFGTWNSGVSKFDGTNWTTYNTSNTTGGLASNGVGAIAVDKNNNLWFGTGGGASKFDGTSWTIYNTSSGLAGNSVYAIVEDQEGNLWFGTNGGASKFDGTDWETFDNSNSGLKGNFVYAIAEDKEGNLWFGTDYGAFKLEGTNWTTYRESSSGLFDNHIKDIAVDSDGNIWFACGAYWAREGVSKFDGANWTTYRDSNIGLADRNVRSLAVGQEGNIWFATRYGASVLSRVKKTGVLLWQTDISINQGASETQELATEIGKLNRTGKFFFEGELTSSTEQKIAEAEYPFYIAETDTILILSSDKKTYPAGETIFIQGEVKNLAQADLHNVTLKIEKQSFEEGSVPEEIRTETFDVTAEGSYPFNLEIPASEEGAFVLTGIVTQNDQEIAKANEQYQVSNPHISATVSAPDVVGLNPFDITTELENTGLIDGTLTVNIQPSGFSEEVIVPAGKKKLVTSPQQIVQTTTFAISLTGDHEESITKDVLYGLGAEILITPQALFPEGRVEIPVKVTNTGLLENQVGIDFTLSLNSAPPTQFIKSYYLPTGQFVDDTLGFDLSDGNYTLTWNSLYSAAQMSFEVKPLEKMEMTAELGAQTEGVFPLNVNLANAGFDDFSGSISVESDIYSSFQEVTLASGSSNLFTFGIIPEGIADGEYNLLVKLLRLDNTSVREQTVSLAVTKPQFGLKSLPTGLSFSTGEDASFPFTLKNTGSQEGRASLKVEVMDMESADDLYLGAGQEKDLSFAFLVPYDLPQGDYVGKYSLAQEGAPLPLQGEFRFNVQGIDIDVEAQLDKSTYTEGETALLTLTITNNSQTSIDLFAKVNYRDYEGEQSFFLETSSLLDFSIPLPEITEEKVFYGIYHRDGRGIHLNDIYIYKKEEGVEVLTDKQVYYPGETVAIMIDSPGAGLMRVEAPGYEDEFTIDGSTSKSFTLPSDLIAGTYGVSWSFFSSDEGGSFSGVRLFDVAGLKVVVTEASLDKPRYSPGDTIQTRLVFESNQDVSALMKLWIINPEGDYSGAGSIQISLSSAEHTIATQSTSFDSSYAGMHRLVYALYTSDDKLIVSGSEAFDCGGGVILGVSTEKRDYPQATEEVKTFVSLFGDGEAPLALFIDDEQIKTMTVALSGVTTEEIVLQSSQLDPGTLGLRAELQKDNLLSRKDTSFNYGSSLPDLILTGLTYESEALNYTIRADAVNQGLNNSSATSIAFYEGDPDAGGTLIGAAGIGGLDAGESSGAEIQWSGQGKSGNRVIYAVVDSANSVKEFNEENNEASLSLNIPEIFHELRLDKPAYSAYDDLYITAYIINNKNTTIQGTLELIIINLSSMTEVWYHSDDISIEGTSAQSVLSNLYNYNLGPNPEAEYRITLILTLDGEKLIDEVIFTVLKTENVAGTFTLEPCIINSNQEEDVLVSVDLQSRGNVEIEGGSLKLEIEKKENGNSAWEKQIEFNLDIEESKNLKEWITLNLAEGFYTVKLLFDEEILDEQELEAKVQIEYTKEESLAPRVLILANRWSRFFDGFEGDWTKKRKKWKNYSELSLIEEALDEAGIDYKIETNPITQIRELRSGTYNIIILLDPMLIFSHVFQEIKERVWRGEGVIGIFTRSWRKEFIEELFGIKIKGWPRKKEKTIETYTTPISSEGEFTLQSDFARIVPEEENLVIVGKIKGDKNPAITLNYYGQGRAVAFGFKLNASPEAQSYEALKQILLGSFSYLKPQEEKDATISRLVPIELTFQNQASSAAQLKIEEEIPHEVKLISAEPEPDEKDSLSWTFTMNPSRPKNLRYEVELPDLKGEYQFKTSIIKVEEETEFLIDTSALSYSVEKTVRELITETITEIEGLPLTSYKDRAKVRKVVKSLARIQNRDETGRFAYHKNLFDTLSALKYTEKLDTAAANHIRKSLVDLMLYYERRTVDEEKKMGFSSVVDLKNLR